MRERVTVICECKGQFLFERKAPSRCSRPGGKIELAKWPVDAAARELREETGLVAQAIAYLFQFGGFDQAKDTIRQQLQALALERAAAQFTGDPLKNATIQQ